MNFWQKFKNHGQQSVTLSLEIDTQSVGAMVSNVDYSQGTVANLAVDKCWFEDRCIRGGSVVSVEKLASCCEQVIQRVTSVTPTISSGVVLGFSGDMIKLHNYIFEYERKNPAQVLTLSELTEILQQAHRQAIASIDQHYIFSNIGFSGVQLISSDVVDFSIDGYKVCDPINMKGGKIKLRIVCFFVLSAEFAIINQLVEKINLPLQQVAYSPYAVLRAINIENCLNLEVIMFDIRSDNTDIVVVRNGYISNIISFALGERAFIDKIAAYFNLNYLQARGLWVKYINRDEREVDVKQIDDILDSVLDVWLDGVKISLESCVDCFLLPSQFFILGEAGGLSRIVSKLNTLKDSDLSFTKNWQVKVLTVKDVLMYQEMFYRENVKDVKLACLPFVSLKRLDGEDVLNRVLERIILNK